MFASYSDRECGPNRRINSACFYGHSFAQARSEVANAAAPRPNIVLIAGDDIGYGDLSWYGNKDIAKPNLDAITVGGTRFTSGCAMHATILHQMRFDYERLTCRHGGRDWRLADAHGRVVREILA